MEHSKLIFIHGLSGVGQTTIGNELSRRLNGNISGKSIVIDQDWFYTKMKPSITYERDDGIYVTKSNWDTLESINMEGLNKSIRDGLSIYKYVIVTGFALRQDIFINEKLESCMGLINIPDVNILLTYNSSENLTEKVQEQRSQSKSLNVTEDLQRIKKVIIPYYLETLTHIGEYISIDVFDDKGDRKDVASVVNEIMFLI
jgi:thymidylate kinase